MLGFRISTFGWGKGLLIYKENHNTIVCNLSRYFLAGNQALLALPSPPPTKCRDPKAEHEIDAYLNISGYMGLYVY